MRRRTFVQLAAGACAPPAFSRLNAAPARRPNIVLIYTDDVGWGDLGCYGARRLQTPNLDRLAARGVRFTDAHAPAATCTPSRYGLLTGQYPWRKEGATILPGNAALIIDTRQTTLASMLKRAGYATGCVGKWHLGLGTGDVDWNGDVKPGPLELGFDYCFLIPATGDRVPCVYLENHRVVGLDPKDPIRVSYGKPIGNEPTGRDNPELLKVKHTHGHDNTIINGIGRIGFMTGGKSARWKDEDMADVITRRAQAFIEKSAGRPFFLYFSTHDIHVPRVPHQRFVGGSQCGVRCDVMHQADWCAGEIFKTLDRLKLTENTLVVFSSDNGPVINDGYADGSVETLGDHKPAGPWRGGKYSNFEGGTRVPFITSWPGRIKPGVSDALIGQVDLLASLAALTGQKLGPEEGPDSFNMLPALLGDSRRGRDHLVNQARTQNLRQGQWKLIPPNPGPAVNKNTNTEMGSGAEAQLYDLAKDPGETRNLAPQNPERVRAMTALLERIRSAGRSRP